MTAISDLHHFLRQAGYDPAHLSHLAGDASPRRYYRVKKAADTDATLVVMDSADEMTTLPAFIAMTEWLAGAGLSVPTILGAAPDDGFLLLEDLGDDLFARLLEKDGAAEESYYRQAVRILVHLAKQPVPDFLPPYDDSFMKMEVDIFVDWFLPAMGIELTESQQQAWTHLWQDIFDATRLLPPIVTLRDYHAENLIWLPRRDGLKAVGLLDYQGAMAGSVAYDLISLLEDARRDVSPALRDMLRQEFAAALSLDQADFQRTAAAMAAQRNIKIVGIFIRLFKTQGKARYLDLLPRMWGLLDGNLAHPVNAALKDFLHQILPTRETVADWCPTMEKIA